MKKLFAIVLSAMLLALCFAVTAGAAEYVYYQNDFSDASTLSDFTQYRGEWDIVDGQLMLVGFGELEMDDHGWLLYTKDEGIMNLTDYILEVDMMNVQTQAGPILRSDLESIVPEGNSGFCGYMAFTSFSGTKGAQGFAKLDGTWGGNIEVSPDIFTPGCNIHLTATVEGKDFTFVITELETGVELWGTSNERDDYAYGTFGFRSAIMKNGITNLGTLGYDNLKVTAIGDVADHLAAGKPLSTYVPKVKSAAIKPDMTPAIEVVLPEVVEVDASKLDASATEYVFYENDFSDPATIADFTMYRGNWAIKNGALYYDSLKVGYEDASNLAFILYTKNHVVNVLKNYTVEMDMLNSQSAAGIITHADLSRASSKSGNSIFGYLDFVSNDGTKAAAGRSNFEDGWAGNLKVSDPILTPGSNYHLVVTHMDGVHTYSIYELGSDTPIWTYEGDNKEWTKGSFGIRSVSTKDLLTNLGTVAFDNFKVTVHGEEAVLLNAGYQPNAKINGKLVIAKPVETAPATPDVTVAPDATADVTVDATADVTVDVDATVAPDATDAPDAPEATKAPDVDVTPDETAPAVVTTDATTAPAEGGAPVGIIIAIVVAVVVIAVVVVVILKKKKN